MESSKKLGFFDNMFGRATNWGKAIIFIISVIFFGTTFYYQVDQNTTKIESIFKYQETQIKTLENRIEKKYNRQQNYIELLNEKIQTLKRELEAEKIKTVKFRKYQEGFEAGQKIKTKL